MTFLLDYNLTYLVGGELTFGGEGIKIWWGDFSTWGE